MIKVWFNWSSILKMELIFLEFEFQTNSLWERQMLICLWRWLVENLFGRNVRLRHPCFPAILSIYQTQLVNPCKPHIELRNSKFQNQHGRCWKDLDPEVNFIPTIALVSWSTGQGTWVDDELSKANQVERPRQLQSLFWFVCATEVFFWKHPRCCFQRVARIDFQSFAGAFLLEKKLPELSPSIDPFENAPMPFCVKMHIKGSRIESLLHDAQRYFCTGSFESMTNGTGPSRWCRKPRQQGDIYR